MDGGERNGVAWRERGKQGGAHGSNMQPLCHCTATEICDCIGVDAIEGDFAGAGDDGRRLCEQRNDAVAIGGLWGRGAKTRVEMNRIMSSVVTNL